VGGREQTVVLTDAFEKLPWKSPVTAQHFLFRAEQTSAADGTYWISRIPRPVLIERDEADGVVLPFEPYTLLSAASAEGSLVPSIKSALLPNWRPPSRESHQFADNAEALVDAVSAWLDASLRFRWKVA
jgi:hypothetical protein